METGDALRALAALAQEHRLGAFRVLVRAGPSGLPAGDIAKAVGISPASLSFHLKELDRAALVRSWRQGRSIRYAAHVDTMRALLEFLTHDCCMGQPELCGAGISGAAAALADSCWEEKK